MAMTEFKIGDIVRMAVDHRDWKGTVTGVALRGSPFDEVIVRGLGNHSLDLIIPAKMLELANPKYPPRPDIKLGASGGD